MQNLIRRLPGKDDKNAVSNESEEELDFDKNFAGMILCTHVGVNRTEWILDYGAIYHMTYGFDHLVESKTLKAKSNITYQMDIPLKSHLLEKSSRQMN